MRVQLSQGQAKITVKDHCFQRAMQMLFMLVQRTKVPATAASSQPANYGKWESGCGSDTKMSIKMWMNSVWGKTSISHNKQNKPKFRWLLLGSNTRSLYLLASIARSRWGGWKAPSISSQETVGPDMCGLEERGRSCHGFACMDVPDVQDPLETPESQKVKEPWRSGIKLRVSKSWLRSLRSCTQCLFGTLVSPHPSFGLRINPLGDVVGVWHFELYIRRCLECFRHLS